MSKKTKRAADMTVQNSLTKVLFLDSECICLRCFLNNFFTILIVEQLVNEDQNCLDIKEVELPRKKSLLVASNNQIFELLQFNEGHRSWFLNEAVASNGKIYLTSKVDPLFIFLQFLERDCTKQAQPLEQIMDGEARMFTEVLKMEQMRLVADQKGPDDLKAFKFNEDKTLSWLKKKFTMIKSSLRQQKVISTGSSSMNFVKSSLEEEDIDEDAIAEAALGIISEYISLELIEKLDNFYGISEKTKEPATQKRKSEAGLNESDKKRIKMEEQENLPEEPAKNVKAVPKVTTKSKALEKAAKGSKAISSFFTKK